MRKTKRALGEKSPADKERELHNEDTRCENWKKTVALTQYWRSMATARRHMEFSRLMDTSPARQG